jgi:hypothetical protein
MVEARDPWTMGGTYTKEQIEAFRGPLGAGTNGNGQGTAGGTLPEVRKDARVCALAECNKEVTGGHGARFCSEVHRKKAAHRRAAERERSNGVANASTRSADQPLSAEELANATSAADRSRPTRDLSRLMPKSELVRPSDRSETLRSSEVFSGHPFEQLAAVAGALPPGWTLQATSAGVTINWTR